MAEFGNNFQFTRPDFGKNPLQFLSEVRSELSKVTWPTRPTVLKLTLVVVIVSALVGVYLGTLDFVFAKTIELILSKK